MMEHKEKFTAAEENPLEYTDIHNDYTKLLDDHIDAKLKETYSEEQVTAFYDSFKEDFSSYKETSPEVCDQLWDFLDFPIFKEKMIALNALEIPVWSWPPISKKMGDTEKWRYVFDIF